MRVVTVTAPGVPDNIVLAERPTPLPGAGEVAIDVAYCGCNWGDTMHLDGSYPHPTPYPLVPGWEVSGHVASIGKGVEDLAVGDLVAAYLPEGGGYAERCIAQSTDVIRLPEGLDLTQGAAFPVQSLTAWHMLHTIGGIAAGQTVLIHAIGGGVGLQATQIAIAAGARVIGTVGTAGKERRALDYGATLVINRDEADFVAAALTLTDGAGVDLVLDSLGGATLDRSFEAVRPLGRVVSIGEAEGRPLPTLWSRLVPRSLGFTRFHLGHVARETAAWRSGVDGVLRLVAEGRVRLPVEGILPLDRAAGALERLKSRRVAGKLLLATGLVPPHRAAR